MRELIANATFALTMILAAAPSLAQGAKTAYSTADFLDILAPAAVPEGNAGAPGITLRGLEAGEGTGTPPPGTKGSGTVPDLKLFFAYDSAELTPDTVAVLDNLGVALQDERLRPYSYRIAGHTDAAGSDAYNQALSERRAKAVVGYLVGRKGVEDGRLEPQGFGESELAEPDDPMSSTNRRVEISLIR